MRITCSTCGKRISSKWLILGMPWSRYTCTGCDSVYAGTLLRLVLVSISTGLLGYLLIGVVKGKMNPLVLPVPLALTLIVLFLNLPRQVTRIEMPPGSDDFTTKP